MAILIRGVKALYFPFIVFSAWVSVVRRTFPAFCTSAGQQEAKRSSSAALFNAQTIQLKNILRCSHNSDFTIPSLIQQGHQIPRYVMSRSSSRGEMASEAASAVDEGSVTLLASAISLGNLEIPYPMPPMAPIVRICARNSGRGSLALACLLVGLLGGGGWLRGPSWPQPAAIQGSRGEGLCSAGGGLARGTTYTTAIRIEHHRESLLLM